VLTAKFIEGTRWVRWTDALPMIVLTDVWQQRRPHQCFSKVKACRECLARGMASHIRMGERNVQTIQYAGGSSICSKP
jgi:hypothetical protein